MHIQSTKRQHRRPSPFAHVSRVGLLFHAYQSSIIIWCCILAASFHLLLLLGGVASCQPPCSTLSAHGLTEGTHCDLHIPAVSLQALCCVTCRACSIGDCSATRCSVYCPTGAVWSKACALGPPPRDPISVLAGRVPASASVDVCLSPPSLLEAVPRQQQAGKAAGTQGPLACHHRPAQRGACVGIPGTTVAWPAVTLSHVLLQQWVVPPWASERGRWHQGPLWQLGLCSCTAGVHTRVVVSCVSCQLAAVDRQAAARLGCAPPQTVQLSLVLEFWGGQTLPGSSC